MFLYSHLRRHIARTRLSAGVFTLLLVLGLTAPLHAGDSYLASSRLNGVELLAPPPAAGSTEEAADLACSRAVFEARTPAEKERALKDEKITVFIFSRAIGSAFQPGKLPKTEALMKQVVKDIGETINVPKNHWKRLRPYQIDPRLTLGRPEPSFSYPSGHSTRGTVYALVLAEIFPEKKEAILEVGREIGWDRVLIGKHFMTDIYAGRVLGKAIARELMANTDFQRDLAEAKAEVAQLKSEPEPVEAAAGK